MQVNDVGTQQTPYYVKYFYTVSCAKKYTSKYKSIQLQFKQQNMIMVYCKQHTTHTQRYLSKSHQQTFPNSLDLVPIMKLQSPQRFL